MAGASLKDTLQSIDWPGNVSAFAAKSDALKSLDKGCRLVALWTDALIFQDFDNPTLPFLQEMKASCFYVPACLSLGLYKPAATLMRSFVENALYFSYFKDHHSELATLARNSSFFLDRTAIMAYHEIHTLGFKEKQAALNLASLLKEWYGTISAVIHGRVPGLWSAPSLIETAFDDLKNDAALEAFDTAVRIVNYIFLSTTPHEIWEGIRPDTRARFLKGLKGTQKIAILSYPD